MAEYKSTMEADHDIYLTESSVYAVNKLYSMRVIFASFFGYKWLTNLAGYLL